MVTRPNHQAPREYSNATFKNAHVYVQREARYIFALQEGGSKGDDRWIGAAQKFLHIRDVGQSGRFVEPWVESRL